VKHVDRICKQEVVERRLDLGVCREDERTAKYCGVSATTVKKHQKGEQKDKLRKTFELCGDRMAGNYERAAGDFDFRVVKRTQVLFMLSR
jgi:hypothetical protein